VIPGGVLEDKVVGGIFITCLSTCDRYFPALMRVMFAGNTPADAVYLSELDVHAAAADLSARPKELPVVRPAAKSAPRRRRKSSRPKPTQELPDSSTKDSTSGPSVGNKESTES